MELDLEIQPDAVDDLDEAFNWYEGKRPGLGGEFLMCVEAALAQVRRTPLLYREVHRGVRRALVRRFPYPVFYVRREDTIVVVAVFHGRRDPALIKRRV